MKKTGIVTLSAAENYGAVLQSYSLCEYINQKWGEAEIINFVPDFIIGRYKKYVINTSSLRWFLESLIANIIIVPRLLIKHQKFRKFRKQYMKLSQTIYERKISSDDYDRYIVGSDQIWNLDLTNWDENFFLPFLKKRKFSYAASLGVDKLTQKQKEFFIANLKDFEAISVREKIGTSIIQELMTEKKIYNNVDPVFLNDKSFWKRLVKERSIVKNYILVYAFQNIEKSLLLAKQFSKGERDIILIDDSLCRYGKGIHKAAGVGPIDFLTLIYYADVVITDSFHGTAFSIIFEKQFNVIPYEKTSSRMRNILEELNLNQKLITSEKINDTLIDYDLVRERMDSLKKNTDHYFELIYRREH